ncbi:hypothetical protein LW139_07780 [Proteus vulgaris]|uniref:hypothetical protein n=1 Tax=Proteus vulgaris TaxID=585 RepID=UPI001FFFDA03|nr:hypothetical protein [Proteus vulgaris]UPK82578.1 hypothetical protein LW139_07780 [Proteus vulgaris]
MNITINDDGSVCIKTNSYSASYFANGNLKFSIGGKAPEKITINHPKKEIGELIYKVSVDTTELDKLEEQLIRIKQLMQDMGINISIKPKQSNDLFIAGLGDCFIKDAVINSPRIKFSASGDAVFSGVLAIGKVEQDAKAQLTNLGMQIDRQDVAINELKRVMETQQQAWSQTVSELTNRTWCSQG